MFPRSRAVRVTRVRGLALWLVAQLLLFFASGLTHSHTTGSGAVSIAPLAQDGSFVLEEGAWLKAFAGRPGQTAPDCFLCDAARAASAAVPALSSGALYLMVCDRRPATILTSPRTCLLALPATRAPPAV